MKNMIIFIALILFSCNLDKEDDDQLSLTKTSYSGNELKIDGYYYTIFENKRQSISFFYESGIYLDLGGNANNSLDADNYIASFSTNNDFRSSRIWWGLFKINGDNITYEKWYPSGTAYKAYVRTGKIINDSTFNVTESYRVVNGDKTNFGNINETYYYRKFSPKPDSTNDFIK
jgi:hypothetical protein